MPRFLGGAALCELATVVFRSDCGLQITHTRGQGKVRPWRRIKGGPFGPAPSPWPQPSLGGASGTGTLHTRGVLIIHTNLQVKCRVKNRNATVYNKIKNIKSPNPKLLLAEFPVFWRNKPLTVLGTNTNPSMCWLPPSPASSDPQPPSVSREAFTGTGSVLCLHRLDPTPLPAAGPLRTSGGCRDSGSWLQIRRPFQSVGQVGDAGGCGRGGSRTQESGGLDSSSTSLLTSSVTLGRSLTLSGPWLPHLRKEGINRPKVFKPV